MTKLILICFFLSGCSLLQRSDDSGYADNKQRWSRIKKVEGGGNKPAYSEKTRLQSLENSLSTKKEIEQYSKMLPWFEGDQEKIDFLTLGNFEDRQRWLNEKSFLQRPQKQNDNMDGLVQNQDIAVGMPQTLVKRSWGDPDTVEVSGNPQFKNERWRYNRYVSTPDGYKPERKVVYFEGGKVVGWELE